MRQIVGRTYKVQRNPKHMGLLGDNILGSEPPRGVPAQP